MEVAYVIGLVLMAALAVLSFISVRKAPSGYGRYLDAVSVKTIAARRGWLIFEAPQWFAFALTFLLAAHPDHWNATALTLFALWQGHYIYRALVMPFLMRIGSKRLPVSNLWFGIVFNSLNGFLNGYAVGHAKHLANAAWLSDPRFWIGLAIAATGWLINVHADNTLFRLRKPGETGYKVPRGGMFRFVSAANYFGEIVLWCGWAVMSWTAAGLMFAVFTIANLGPRALSHHRWYRTTFPDYPPDRKALIPFVL